MHKWQNESADVDSRAPGQDIYKNKPTSSLLRARVYVCKKINQLLKERHGNSHRLILAFIAEQESVKYVNLNFAHAWRKPQEQTKPAHPCISCGGYEARRSQKGCQAIISGGCSAVHRWGNPNSRGWAIHNAHRSQAEHLIKNNTSLFVWESVSSF